MANEDSIGKGVMGGGIFFFGDEFVCRCLAIGSVGVEDCPLLFLIPAAVPLCTDFSFLPSTKEDGELDCGCLMRR